MEIHSQLLIFHSIFHLFLLFLSIFLEPSFTGTQLVIFPQTPPQLPFSFLLPHQPHSIPSAPTNGAENPPVSFLALSHPDIPLSGINPIFQLPRGGAPLGSIKGGISSLLPRAPPPRPHGTRLETETLKC